MKRDWKLNSNELLSVYRNRKASTLERLNSLELMYYNKGYKKPLYRVNSINFGNISEAKSLFLEKMRHDYRLIGEKLIKYILELQKMDIFNIDTDTPIYVNSMDKIAEITLELYSKFSNTFYKIAKEMIDNKQVLVVENAEIPSYMIYLNSINKSFCVIDKNDNPNTLIHEIEHGIEATLNFMVPDIYSELGSITFENLFIDELIDRKTNSAELLYAKRVLDCKNILDDLGDYFKMILYAKSNNFNMTTSKFIIMAETIMHVDKNKILEFLNDEFNNNYFQEELVYLLSYIKSLEMRNIMLNDKKKGIIRLEKTLNKPDYTFNSNEKSIDNIKHFVKEISIKK